MSLDPTREVELKLDVEPAAVRDLRERRLQRLGADGGARQAMTAVYFDTKKFSLNRRGISLRIRIEGDRRIQTMKGPNQDGSAMFDRLEWSVEVKGDKPDLSGIEATPFRDLVSAERLRQRLRPVFTTEVERTAWQLRSDAAAIELALDEGRIAVDGRTEPLAELELELKSGPRAELFRVARSLGPAGAFRIGVLTKAERGYALAAAGAPAAVKAEPLTLRPDMTAADAFRAIVGACVRHFRLNERLVTEARSAEGLHQARVALRRLRSALSLFKDVIADDEIGKLKAGLRRIWQRLGEARDLDVFLADLDKPGAAAVPLREDRGELVERLRRQREQAYDRVVAALREGRFQRLMLDLVAWSETGPWLTASDPDIRARREEPLATFAADVLTRRRRKVRKRGRDLAGLDASAQHQVRIEAKKLRYATEYFSALAETKKARKRHRTFLKTLEDLQEHLGRLNDLATGERMAQGLPHDAPQPADGPSRPDAAGEPVHRDDDEIRKALAAATEVFRDFAEAKPFWPSEGRRRDGTLRP
jgi:inorganic triphosphatase YgiF